MWNISNTSLYISPQLHLLIRFRPKASGTDQISQKCTDSCYRKIAHGKVICDQESGKFLRVESGILGLEFLIQLKEYGFPLTTEIRIPSSTDKESVACSRLNREFKIRRLRTTATVKHATAHDQNHVTVNFSHVVRRLR